MLNTFLDMKIESQLQKVINASRKLNLVSASQNKKVLLELAKQSLSDAEYILSENKKDLDRMDIN